MVRFVRASMKGWKYAERNPNEAAEIVLDNDATGAQTEKHQKRMMGEIANLQQALMGNWIQKIMRGLYLLYLLEALILSFLKSQQVHGPMKLQI